MTSVKLKYLKVYHDRHGKKRAYLRKKGLPQVALPGEILSEEFMIAYHAALRNEPVISEPATINKITAGSIEDALYRWYDSTKFKSLEPKTQLHYQQIMKNALSDKWHLPIKAVYRRHVNEWLSEMSDRPGAANQFLKRLKTFFRFCVSADIIPINPAAEAEKAQYETEGFAPWDDNDIKLYTERWTIDTKQYLCFALLSYTGQRISDVAKMTEADDQKDRISIMQAKLRKNKTRVRIKVKVHPKLREALNMHPRQAGQPTMMTEYGNGYSAKGLSQDFSKWSSMAGLGAKKTAHGLRKYAGRRLAEAGATPHQIMAVLGLNSLREAERYTQSANKTKLADDAMDLIE